MLRVLTRGCEPTKGSKYSAGIDLYASENCSIGIGETEIVGLGVCIDVQKFTSDVAKTYRNDGINVVLDKIENFKLSHYLELHLHSDLIAKGLISNTNIINLDYKDEIEIIIQNHFTLSGFEIDLNDGIHLPKMLQNYTIKKGDKIAQILLKGHKGYLFGIESHNEHTYE